MRAGVGVVRVYALYRLPIHILKKKLPNNFNQTTIDVVHFLAQRPGPFFLNCHFPFIVEDGEGSCSISSSCPCPRKNKKRKKERKGSHNSNQDQMDVVHFFALHPVLVFLNCRCPLLLVWKLLQFRLCFLSISLFLWTSRVGFIFIPGIDGLQTFGRERPVEKVDSIQVW